jgi:competence protein ComGC
MSLILFLFIPPHSIDDSTIGTEGAAAIGKLLKHNKTLTHFA